MEYFNEKVLLMISTFFGKPLKTDIITVTSSRGKFTCICVVVDLAKPLIPAYTLYRHSYKVEYEFIHNLCYKCWQVGHMGNICSFVSSPVPIDVQLSVIQATPVNSVSNGNMGSHRDGQPIDSEGAKPNQSPVNQGLTVSSTLGRGCLLRGISENLLLI